MMATLRSNEAVPGEQAGPLAGDTENEKNVEQGNAAPEQETLPEPGAPESIETEQAAPEHEKRAEAPEVTSEGVDFSEEEAQLSASAPEFDLGDATEDETNDPATEELDLSSKNREALVELFAALLEEQPVQGLRRSVEAIKVAFYKQHNAWVEQLRRMYVEAGGVPEDFVPEPDPSEAHFKELFSEYRCRRDAYIAGLERQKEENMQAKLRIIEELRALADSNETLNNTFNTFRELQQRWKETGPVPQAQTKDLWETYNLHVENFYNYIKINKELRDLDLKRNFEVKTRLCEEAEKLILEQSVVAAFRKLQQLHDQWRETGPVARELKEALWNRFHEASLRINKQHQEYFEGLKEEQKRNLELKNELCVKAEELLAALPGSRKDWNKASERLIEIQKVWKTIGFAPKKDNARIYERFRNACDRFFEHKRAYYVRMKGEMDENLARKTEICEAAEALCQSDQWKKVSDELIALQRRWKEIGPVSRRHSDAIWKRFRAACDTFFERKSAHFSSVDAQHADNLRKKEELLAEIEAADMQSVTFDAIKEYQRRWSEIGFVPIRQKDAVQARYKAIMDQLFNTLRSGERGRNLDRYRDRVSGMKENGDRRLRTERDRLYNKVKQLESDIATLENNIGFFSMSKNAEAMIREVRAKIDRARSEREEIIEKIRLIDKQE